MQMCSTCNGAVLVFDYYMQCFYSGNRRSEPSNNLQDTISAQVHVYGLIIINVWTLIMTVVSVRL